MLKTALVDHSRKLHATSTHCCSIAHFAWKIRDFQGPQAESDGFATFFRLNV